MSYSVGDTSKPSLEFTTEIMTQAFPGQVVRGTGKTGTITEPFASLLTLDLLT